MSILVVSDIHSEVKPHHGVQEDKAVDWLVSIIEHHAPDSLIGLGDFGSFWTPEKWKQITDLANCNFIYGNHENLPLLSQIRNSDSSKALMHDGEVRVVDGLRVGGVNGIMALTPNKVKEGIPRKTPAEFWDCANNLKGRIDILATHESPYDESYGARIHRDGGCETMRAILAANQPPIALSGHLSGPYTIAHIEKTTSIRVDSSPSEKVYALLEKENSNTVSAHVYHDLARIGSLLIPLA